MHESTETSIARAAEQIREAEGLLIAGGAGMGVDSGLPDFRGPEGFWKAYPALKHLRVSFAEMANPRWFEDRPAMAWAFYGHRFQLYARTTPHRGYELLRQWAAGKPHGAFVFTSNVDGHFAKAGFAADRIYECHGSLCHLQCNEGCSREIWELEELDLRIDLETLTAHGELPRCGRCGGLARPNVLMFGDWSWVADRSDAQERRLERWRKEAAGRRLAVVECGAGTAVPTVRMFCESAARRLGVPLIRINPNESHGPTGTLSLALPAQAALEQIERAGI